MNTNNINTDIAILVMQAEKTLQYDFDNLELLRDRLTKLTGKCRELFNIYYIDRIEKIAGYREKEILKNLVTVELKQLDNDYFVLRYYDNNHNYFDFEVNSNRITG